nr:DeoR/GlpR family DNA-binding transcription regulator [uncultured Sphaerochaeta sp.]
MLIEKRLETIMFAVKRHGSLSYEEAIELTGCSKDTARRDFIKLCGENLVTRTRGGILYKDSSVFDYDKGYSDADTRIQLRAEATIPTIKNFNEKQQIGKLAAHMVKGCHTIMVDSGSTTLSMIRQLEKQQDLTIITNCLRIANELVNRSDIHTIMLGGDLNSGTLSIMGYDALHMIKHYNVDILFLGTAALSIEKGIMTPYSIEAMLKREMIASANKVVLLIDSSKMQKFALYSFSEITNISTIITDENIPSQIKERFEALGIEVLIAKNLK